MADGMLAVIDYVEVRPRRLAERRDDAGNQAIAAAGDRALLAIHRDAADEQPIPGGAALLIVAKHEPVAFAGQVGRLEPAPDVGGTELAAGFVGQRLDVAAEIGLQALGQLQALVLFDHPGDAALARLRIDADHRFVAAAEIGGVDRQIGDLPRLVVLLFAGRKPLLDRVLMAARKGGEHQLAGIGGAGMDGDARRAAGRPLACTY
ncbi:hypothetical protein WR25_16463 [Diploscapter pachys]|uniref:Uncharacterized protein n=1 Tax=Diploscapter pachys TaxID=2018661 RepID=A0A2A2M4D2_9BILA|nr:hypothetical protein WR25_16463 [Diploscapter pachys]